MLLLLLLCNLYYNIITVSTYRCYSYLGMIGSGGEQDISIGRGCEYKAIVQHEILHALGRIHEQCRTDRDKYVRINEENIIEGNYVW